MTVKPPLTLSLLASLEALTGGPTLHGPSEAQVASTRTRCFCCCQKLQPLKLPTPCRGQGQARQSPQPSPSRPTQLQQPQASPKPKQEASASSPSKAAPAERQDSFQEPAQVSSRCTGWAGPRWAALYAGAAGAVSICCGVAAPAGQLNAGSLGQTKIL